ncbi:MAG: universal stress protein [Planctomycetes bacterium]|nr:universal stress protein [Planctomycetota bacterium]
MYDPSERKIDRDVEESMRLFQRSQVGEAAPLAPLQPKRVLVAADGSSQDATSIAVADRLRKRFGCELAVLDARDSAAGDDLTNKLTAGLQDVEQLTKPSGESFEQILSAAESWKCDLLILPCPYGRDFEKVGADSAGTVLDVLLARSPIPLIAIRRPFEPEAAPFQRVVFSLWRENEAAVLAASWAAGMIAPGGHLRLELVLEEEFYENIRDVMGALDESIKFDAEKLCNALAASHAHMHRTLQKTATAHNFVYELTVCREAEAHEMDVTEEASHALFAVGLERSDHASHGHVQDRVRRAASPVLVAPR